MGGEKRRGVGSEDEAETSEEDGVGEDCEAVTEMMEEDGGVAVLGAAGDDVSGVAAIADAAV